MFGLFWPLPPRDVTLLATGSEVGLAVEAAEALAKSGVQAAVVSMPSFELFRKQSAAYRLEVLGSAPRVAIEAGVQQPWFEWLSDMDRFVGMLKDYPNLYLDTTMAIGGFFPNPIHREWFAENADRLVFGTDFPNIPYPWHREYQALLAMKLGSETEKKILHDNAARLLRFD